VERWKEEMPEAVARQVIKIAAGTDHGDILGFLPTTASINTAVGIIKEGLEAKRLRFDVYPLLSTTPKDTQERALEARTRGDRRKIVISSNLAETSLTVKGVRYVVDSGLICQSKWDPGMASGSFPTEPHSRSGVRQRWGRVGRDAPGWVFPLYSLEQFRQLPRNTPPGSTQANLETFYMKLMSAGLDVESVSLPANFTHENVTCDEQGLRNIETFNRESDRALKALRTSGAVDSDGCLTDFGRDLERFPGSGAEAVAIMLADQLACVHEVAFALAVLGGGGSLLRPKGQGLLLMNRDWPPYWRIHAARCHRALAIGCVDDLHLVLRIVSAWQTADDRDQWCKTWWINSSALGEAEMIVGEMISNLSPGMKSDAQRPVNMALADRARAVFAQAMRGLQLRRIGSGSYGFCSNEKEIVSLDRRALVDPGERVLALNRFRIPGKADEPPMSIISNTIRIPDWPAQASNSADTMGIDLIVAAANECRRPDGSLKTAADPLAVVRQVLPIGTCADITIDRKNGEDVIIDAQNIAPPFAYPGETSHLEDDTDESPVVAISIKRRRATKSGFDADWDPNSVPHDCEIPEEELAQQLVDIRTLETNDRSTSSDILTTPLERNADVTALPALPALFARSCYASDAPITSGRVCVLGYELVNANCAALIVTPVAADVSLEHPTSPAGLDFGQTIDLEIRGFARDHEDEFAELRRADLRGSFFLPMAASGISADDRDFVRHLRPGGRLTGQVVPEWKTDAATITLVPFSIQQVRTEASSEQHTFRGDRLTFYPATIITGPNEWDKVLVELDYHNAVSGLSHRFEVKTKELATEHWSLSSDVGQRLLVSLDFDRARRRTLDLTSQKLLKVAEGHSSYLMATKENIVATRNAIPVQVIHELVAIDKRRSWEREVWRFYADNLHLAVRTVRPITSSTTIATPVDLLELLRGKKAEIGQSYHVDITIDSNTGNVKVSGFSLETVNAAVEELEAIARLPYVIGVLPPNTSGIVIGAGGETITELRSRINVIDIQVDREKLFVVGRSANAVQETLRTIRKLVGRASGQLSVPSDKVGRLIGKQGATIKTLSAQTGCRADKRNNGLEWIIEGPDKHSVEEFIRLACGVAPGAKGSVIGSRSLTITRDGTTPKVKPATRAASPTSPKPRSSGRPPLVPSPPTVSPQVPAPQNQSSPTSSSGCLLLVLASALTFLFFLVRAAAALY